MRDKWLLFAERLDALRIVPRLALLGYSTFSMSCIAWLLFWYMDLPTLERTAAVSTLITGTITALLGGSTWYASSYNAGGRDWSNNDGN
jgi:hypothetical protein